MKRHLVVAITTLSLVTAGGAGCGTPSRHSHGGHLVTEYPMRKKPAFGWTRLPAVYALYSQKDRPADFPGAKPVRRVGWELTEVRLAKGSPLGFKVFNGSLVAVAGDDQIPLPPGEYCWHTRPWSEPIDWGATVLAGVAVVAIGFGVVAIAWAATWDGPLGIPG
jgi:hypothetical protein